MAKAYGGAPATKTVAYAWAASMDVEQAGPLLRRVGLGDAAVEAAVEAGDFGRAFALAQVGRRRRCLASLLCGPAPRLEAVQHIPCQRAQHQQANQGALTLCSSTL